MLYYTQLIYIKKGREEVFHRFEDAVLPLLKKHGGELVYRLRPDAGSVIASLGEPPYEIHLVTFENKEGFESYKNDPARAACMSLKNESVERMVLIEGQAL
jgi:uncharacterized protein (DUF1330 family)